MKALKKLLLDLQKNGHEQNMRHFFELDMCCKSFLGNSFEKLSEFSLLDKFFSIYGKPTVETSYFS
jgi:hypothetical protein